MWRLRPTVRHANPCGILGRLPPIISDVKISRGRPEPPTSVAGIVVLAGAYALGATWALIHGVRAGLGWWTTGGVILWLVPAAIWVWRFIRARER